jgi:putative ABC transport system permease protein
MNANPPGLGTARRIYAALLAAYPRAARRRDREDLLSFFEDRYQDAWSAGGRTGAAAASAKAFWDVVRSGLAERFWGTGSAGAGSPISNTGGEGMGEVARDLRLAARGLVRAPAFALVAVLTLALGIGANTAIFSVLSAVALRALPYPDPEQLVVIRRELVRRGIPSYPAAPADLVEYRAADSFEQIAGLVQSQPILQTDGESERLRSVSATPNVFDVLRVQPMLGRLFTAEEGRPQALAEGAPPSLTVVLGHGFWMRRFGGDPNVVGSTIGIGPGATVVGVLPEDFRLTLAPDLNLPEQPDIWLPFVIDEAAPARVSFFLTTIARLKSGASHEAARAELDAIGAVQRERYASAEAAGTHPRLIGMHEDLTAGTRPLLGTLMAAVAFVLLIACVNVSNLLLVRAAVRRQELTIRTALGGSRVRLVRQMLAEVLVLALAGGTLGVLLAASGMEALRALVPPDFPRASEIGVDGGVLLFTAVATLGAAVLFGTIPALRGSRTDLMDSLRSRGAEGSHQRTRSLLVVLEVALSFVLVVAAGLMGRSFFALQRVDPGFRAEGALALRASLPPGSYPDPRARTDVKRLISERLAALPGVLAVGGAGGLPLGQGGVNAAPYGNETALADGDESDLVQSWVRTVFPGYFEAMGTPVVEGRVFGDADLAEDSLRHVVVDRVLAEKAWPGESALGKRLYVKVTTPGIWVEVIGVVEHQRHGGLTGDSREAVYFSDHARGSPGSIVWVLRTAGDPLAVVGAARAAIAEVEPRTLVEEVLPLTDLVEQAETPTRTILLLSGAFGGLAILLAAIGLYGVIAFVIRERTREIGIRVALGAEPPRILGMVLGRGLTLVAVGALLGLVGALYATRLMAAVLVDIESDDPLTLVAACGVFVLVAVAACLAPAGRALRVSPLTALRDG